MNTPFTPRNLHRSISACYVKTIFALCFVTLISLKSVAQFNTTCQYILTGPAGGTSVETGGTGLVLSDDQLSTAIPIGFNFQFYGVTYSNVYISSNGFISFDAGAGNGCCSGQFLPSSAAPNNLIAGYWEDLNPSLGGTITYFTAGTFPNRRFVVYFNGIPHHPGGNAVSFEIKLFETSNVISVLNITCPSDGGAHTVGIEDNTGTIALVPSGRNASNFSSFNETTTFTPIDNIVPTITCPANITVNADPGGCTAVVSYAPTVSDNCSVARVSTIAGLASGSSFPAGTTNITLRARDDGSAGLFSNGAGGTFTFNEGDNAQTIAFRACESYNGVGNCAIGSCGAFTYYYRATDPSCTCGKTPGQYEWVYSNSGYTDVGQDYGGTNAALPGTIPFCRVKGEPGCSVPNTWLLANNNLGGNQNTCSFSVTVNGLAAPTTATVTPSSSCNPTTAQLNAISAGNSINWYTVPTGGTSIGSSASGANFAVSPTATTTYYAEANTIPIVVPTRTFTQSFVNGVAPTTQCTAWTSFLASLTGTYTKMVINSDLNAGITLTDPTTVNAIATAMRTGATLTTTFGGNTYYVGSCGGVELAVNAGSICNCSNAISVRPCIGNANWGGVNTATCNGPSQTITVQFSANAEVYTQSFGSGLTPSFQCTAWNSFQSSLTGTYSELILSSNLSGGITLSDPATVNSIANAIRTGTSLTTSFGGNTYYVGGCGSGTEFAVNAGSICNCSNAYSLRPCIGNSNWGGVNSATCGGPNQTISLQFTRQAATCSSITRTPVVFTSFSPSTPTAVVAIPAAACSGTTVQLNAVSAGNNINWYTVPTGGTSIGSSASGANFAVSPTATTTYYAEAVSPTVAPGSATYNYTGGAQTFVVPAGVTSINVDASGASGMTSTSGAGGLGGRVQATLSVTPGSTINVYVGGQGLSCNTGGFNGGAITPCVYAGSTFQGTGGGASDLRIGGTALSNRVLVAGGGGGAAYNYTSGMQGGNGGGLIAAGGQGGLAGSVPGGGGGTQVGGGIAGFYAGYTSGQPGALGVGGAAGAGTGGGGGGGGYYGGGGGSWGGGGGGSSYTDPSAGGVVHTQGYRSGDGIITISWTGAASCVNATRTPVVFTSLTPSTPTAVVASPSSACNGSTVQLNAISAGNNIDWYTVPTGGTSIGSSASGANFAVSPTGTTTYYAEAVSTTIASGSSTFNFTGGLQTFTVPAGITSVTVDAYGAQGGSPNVGAPGGRMQSTISVVPGQTINLYVGGQGLLNTGGFNGGGGVQGGTSGAFGGGGASDIRIGGTALSNRVVVAGGGGGTGAAGCCGGPAAGIGGGTTGGTGSDCWTDTRGFGGSQIAGGLGSNTTSFCGGTGSNGASGSLGQGGAGGSTACCTPSSINGGGGGGGGYYGGGGSSFGGAGGGSNFSSGAILTNSQGVRSGNGMITISWAGDPPCLSATRTPVVFTANVSSVAPTGVSGTLVLCSGSSTNVAVTGGTKGTGAVAQWYTGSCGGTLVGTGDTIALAPTATTTYFVRYAGTCNTTTCASFTITVNPNPIASISPPSATFCTPTAVTLTASGASGASTLTNVLNAINSNSAALIASIPTPSGFNMDMGVNATFISDGCSDMYDGGNVINTNLATSISYSDNTVIPSASFGTGGQYFTRYLGPGGCQAAPATIFYMAADINGLSSISTTGDNGADGAGSQDLATFSVAAGGVTYTCFLKRVYAAGDPSINQIFMIPQPNSASQAMGGGTNDGLHTISNLTGVTRVYYMLYAGASGAFISTPQATTIAQTFANIIPVGGTYAWSTGATTAPITVTPTSTTTYTCTVTSSGCSTPVSATVTINTPSVAPTSITGTTTICSGASTTLTLSGGTEGTGATAEWFSGSCGGTAAGTGNSITVSPTTTTTYFVRYNGTCNTTTCASITVVVDSLSIAPSSITGTTTICSGASTTLTLSGGTAGTGATAEWFSGSCGGTAEGSGNSITVSPTSTTTYFVRYSGTCNTTTCASATVTVNSLSIAATSTTSTPDHGCEGASITLTASGFTSGLGATPTWWTGAGGTGTNVGTGSSVVTTIISPTYYMRLAGTCNAVESVVNIAMGGPSNVVLASGAATNPISYCEDGLWSYYEHPSLPGKFVFAIRWGTTNAAAKAAAQVFINNNATNISNEATRSGGIKDASYVMKRYWNVDIGGNTLVDPVDIKFFYDPSEISSITADRDAQMGALNAITPGRYFPVSFSWFKTVGAAFTPSLINDGNNFAFSYIPLTPATTGTENGVSYVEFDGISSFSGGTGGIGFSPHASTPLPVTYTTITAKPIANEFIQVAWVCASEINNRGFDVLRSLDGINFEKIGFVNGSNNSSTARAYSFDDYNVVAGREYYYRLNQIDYDGKSEKSAIVSAHLVSAQNSIGEFYPNPTKDITSIDIYVTAANTSSIRLVDAIGQEVLKVDNDLNIGLNKVSLNTNQLAAGMYIAYILVGSEVAQKTIVVTK